MLTACAALIISLSYTRGFHNELKTTPKRRLGLKMEIFEGNPVGRKIWDFVWKTPLFQPGKPGVSPTSFGDAANVIKANILQVYGNEPSFDGAPVAVGEIDGLLEGSLFLGLKSYHESVTRAYKIPNC